MAVVGSEAVQYMSHCFPDISAQRADCGEHTKEAEQESCFPDNADFTLETFYPFLCVFCWGAGPGCFETQELS